MAHRRRPHRPSRAAAGHPHRHGAAGQSRHPTGRRHRRRHAAPKHHHRPKAHHRLPRHVRIPTPSVPPPVQGPHPPVQIVPNRPPRGADRVLRDMHRLLWRAGFGPRPGDAERLAAMPRQDAVHSLTRPAGAAGLVGPDPKTDDGSALAPHDLDGHDHLWWLDRMVRSDQPLVERLTLIFHDWFANSNGKVDSQAQMLDQNALIRARVLGTFDQLFHDITVDPAMLIFLDGTSNVAGSVNENYAREMMELFSGSSRSRG